MQKSDDLGPICSQTGDILEVMNHDVSDDKLYNKILDMYKMPSYIMINSIFRNKL